MDNKMMSDIYKDFFGNPKYKLDEEKTEEEKQIEEKELKDEDVNIDDLFLSDESLELVKKIISYMEKYSKKEVENYITFNITLTSEDDKEVNKLLKVLAYYSKKYNYTKNSDIEIKSLYKLDKEEDIVKCYEKGIISLTELDALNLKDLAFKKKFTYLFKEQLVNKSITVVSAKEDILKEFLLLDDAFDKEYFMFKLEAVKPSVNDVYNEVLKSVKLNEDYNIKVLDYISATYNESTLDYSSYVSKLIIHINFYNDVPEVDKIKPLDEIFSELNGLVGLTDVKKSLNDLVDLISLKNKTKEDLKINDVNLHMVFLGNPGTGKTTVARMIAGILYNLKYIRQNKLIEVSSKDLIAEYVGQTAVKTMDVVNKAMGGILFIDEAYSLADKNGDNSYNAECIATLIKAMEDYRDDLVVIFAGYTKEMQDFLNSNSGIVSRIGYTLEFADYTNEELKQIFEGMAKKAGFIVGNGVLERLEELINENRNMKNFGNARFVRNVFEKSVIRHATNTKDKKQKKILKTLTKEDIVL